MPGNALRVALHAGGSDWNGPGYIAGEAPGLVTVDSAPAARHVFALDRLSKRVAGAAFSLPDGTFRIDFLNPDREFDVIARDYTGTYNDVIVSRVKPEPYA